jgi:hypothetical protein
VFTTNGEWILSALLSSYVHSERSRFDPEGILSAKGLRPIFSAFLVGDAVCVLPISRMFPGVLAILSKVYGVFATDSEYLLGRTSAF